MRTCFRLLFALLFIFICSTGFAQHNKPRISPARSVSGMVKKARITISYSSPSVKGRKIWGALVPYDSVWRAGANEATVFTTDKAIVVAGQPLPAGKYGFFLIPRADGPWTAIFNTVPDQWGAFKYDSGKDQLRVNVSPVPAGQFTEALEYRVDHNGFSLRWEKSALLIPVNSPE